MQDFENTLVNIPVTQEQMERDAFLHDEPRTLAAGQALIVPGQEVEALYLLISGQIDMVRHLGSPREERKRFTYAKGVSTWRPVLGGRYLFTKKASSRHYLAMTECKVLQITHETLRGDLYLSGDCITIVRELLRCSDLPDDSLIRTELDKRFDLFRFPGFDINKPDRLLSVDVTQDVGSYDPDDTSGIERIKSAIKLADSEYVNYAREMVKRLLGEDVDSSRNGETRIGFNAPPLGR